MLSLSVGNGKLKNDTIIFNLPAGRTCPGAKECKSWVTINQDNQRKVVDGPHTEFRCFAASGEALFPAVYNSRKSNFDQIYAALATENAVELIIESIQFKRTKKVTKVRIHESGDFFNADYFLAWCEVAHRMPELKFYCYTKSLRIVNANWNSIPENMFITASKGGRWDSMIEAGYFQRYAQVVYSEQEAIDLGLEIDHDDSHCFGDKPFALLIHGIQPKGTAASKAVWALKQEGKMGYNKKNKV